MMRDQGQQYRIHIELPAGIGGQKAKDANRGIEGGFKGLGLRFIAVEVIEALGESFEHYWRFPNNPLSHSGEMLSDELRWGVAAEAREHLQEMKRVLLSR
jgi:hypothetical protein